MGSVAELDTRDRFWQGRLEGWGGPCVEALAPAGLVNLFFRRVSASGCGLRLELGPHQNWLEFQAGKA